MKNFIFILALFLGACAYKPISTLTRDTLGDSVFVDVIILKSDPENSVVVKDAIREAVIKRLNKDLADKEDASSVIIASIQSVNFKPTSYDRFGYITAYEASVTLLYNVHFSDGEVKDITCKGTSSFRTSRLIENTLYTDSVISNKDRYDAIAEASKESFNEFIAKLALYSNKEE